MDKSVLSIIIPVYGVEKYIKTCLDSVIPQMTDVCELIIVDDCTPDHSIEICRSIISEYGEKHISIIQREKNGGLSAARNAGIEHATGKYCWFIDSDDYILDGAIQRVLNILDNSSIDLLCFDHTRNKENGTIIPTLTSVSEVIELFSDKDKLRVMGRYLLGVWGFEVWRKVFSLDLIKKNNIYFEPNKEIFAEDICFLLYYLTFCNKIKIVPEKNYCYLVRNDSIMGKKTSKLTEMVNLSKKQANYCHRIENFDYFFFVMPRLFEIELIPLTPKADVMCMDLPEKALILDAFKNPLRGVGMRLYLYKKRSTLHQILLMYYVRNTLRGKRTTITESMCKMMKTICKMVEK